MAAYTRLTNKIITITILFVFLLACNMTDALITARDFLNTQVPDTPPEDTQIQPLPTNTETQPIEPRMHIIWDDDGSPDGMIALLYFLHHPEIKVEAITVTSGEAYPQTFAPLILRMLNKLGHAGIPVGAGSETPLAGSNAFPDPWRVATSEFWGIELPEMESQVETLPAAELIVNVLNDSPQPVTIFVSGTHTNLAEALRLDPGIKEKIASVEIMGGALFVPGNIASDWPDNPNETAEWNVYVDPLAANEVFSAGLPLSLTPLDATNSVIWTRLDAGAWRASAVTEGVMASELLNWMLDAWFPEGVYAWDVVAVVNAVHPELCASEDLFVRVITDKGPDEGRTEVVEGEIANLTACLEPDSDGIKAHMIEIFRMK